MRSSSQFIPTKGCSHAYSMLFEDDFCCCSRCNQKWAMTDKGWRAVPASWQDGYDPEPVSVARDPYRRFQAPQGARLKPKGKVRVKKWNGMISGRKNEIPILSGNHIFISSASFKKRPRGWYLRLFKWGWSAGHLSCIEQRSFWV